MPCWRASIGRCITQLAAFHPDLAMAGAEISRHDLGQGGLAGPVVAHQANDLATFQRQGHIIEGMNGAEMLRHILQFEKGHSAVTVDGTDAAPCSCYAIDDRVCEATY